MKLVNTHLWSYYKIKIETERRQDWFSDHWYIPVNYCHITNLLMELHWLPIKLRIQFKIVLIVFKIFKGFAPSYLSSLITRKPESRYNLRNSRDKTLLSYPSFKSKATLGDRAFMFAAPKLWNNLPRDIRESSSINSFKSKLKTFLFKKAFYNW